MGREEFEFERKEPDDCLDLFDYFVGWEYKGVHPVEGIPPLDAV